MEETKGLGQQQLTMQQKQQQFLLMQQQIQQQKQQQHLQQQQQAISRFPSNIDAHLRPPGLHNRLLNQQQQQQHQQHQHQHQHQQQNPNPNPNPSLPNNPPSSNPTTTAIPNQPQNPNSNHPQQQQQQQQQMQMQMQMQLQMQQQQQQQQASRPPAPNANQAELQMAYQDAWRVCHPDFKRPFSSLEDACERLLPYHVVADYEAEEDDRILDSDTTGQMLSRSQQWDHNIAAKVAEFTATFEKQALAFNIISRKRALGEFRSEERLMIEQALLQEEKRAMYEVRAEMESREKAGREAQEAKLRMAAMVQAEQARTESQAHAEMMARGPIRASALNSQVGDIPIGHDMVGEQEHGVHPDEMINGWGNNAHRDEKEPSEDFLNDDENENGDTGMQSEWHEVGEFDLNRR